MPRHSAPRFLGFVCTLLGLASPVWAQATGTIYGIVSDASHAVIPGAEVTARNVNTGQTRTAQADDAGQYVMPLLPVGIYEIRAGKSGFAPFLQSGIALQVNTSVQVNASLQIQSAATQITVQGETSLVQATSSTLVQVVDERRVVDLPLNGRNVLQLMTINAGISDNGAAGGTIQTNTIGHGAYLVPVSINGSRGNATNFLLDNSDNNDGYTNISQPYPNPDAVQEFSIQASTFDAQYGRGVGGVVNVVTRSGTNTLHGSLFEFLRNYQMNAANFFSGRDALKRNQFGFSAGGPVVIPGLYDGRNRTFLFGSYQGTRIRVSTPGALAVAPSDAMKRGDFSAWLQPNGTGAIRDPLAPGEYFPNNQIPVTRFDPVSAKLLNYMPSSPDPSYRLRFATPSSPRDDDQVVLRGDHTISSKQRLSLRYFLFSYNEPWNYLPDNLLYTVSQGMFGYAQNAAVTHTYVASPRLLNELNVAFRRLTPSSIPPKDLNISFASLGANIIGSEYPNMVLGISNWSGINTGIGLYVNGNTTYQVSDTVSYATGRHNLRVGADIKKYVQNKYSFWLTGGSASFSGQLLSTPGKSNAGNSFAEFLLGDVASWRQQSRSSWTMYDYYPVLFAQDDFRVTPKLTLNLGLRWDPQFDFKESHHMRATFIPERQSAMFPNAPRGLLFQGDAGFENTIIPPDYNNLAPRIGLAFQALPSTVVRAAYGIFYDQYIGINNNRTVQAEPFLQQAILTASPSLANIYGSQPPLNPVPVAPGKDFVFHPYGTWAVPGPNVVAGYVQNWNFVIEHQLFGDLLLRAAYVGSKGTHLLYSAEVNPGLYGPGATAANVDQRRPYQPIGGLQLGMPAGNSTYQSAQFTVQKRYSRGFTLLANYTISKSIDNSSYCTFEGNCAGPNPFNFNDNRGLSNFDMPQRMAVSGIAEHPRLEHWNPVLRGVLGGWQSNFILTFESGIPITILSGVDNALMGVGGNFADLTGADWRLPAGRSKGQQVLAWFNKAAFKVNAVGTIGAGRRNQLRQPGQWNVDYSLFKNFRLAERLKLQLRGEFFNLLNHANLGAPNATVTSPLFGQISSATAPRIIQLGLKLIF